MPETRRRCSSGEEGKKKKKRVTFGGIGGARRRILKKTTQRREALLVASKAAQKRTRVAPRRQRRGQSRTAVCQSLLFYRRSSATRSRAKQTPNSKKNRSVWDGWRRSEVGFELEPGLFWTKKESEDEQLRVTVLGDIHFPFKAKKINLGSHCVVCSRMESVLTCQFASPSPARKLASMVTNSSSTRNVTPQSMGDVYSSTEILIDKYQSQQNGPGSLFLPPEIRVEIAAWFKSRSS